MAATIAQIARRVGTSKQAVSYALNNKPGEVSEATRQRILEVARELDYQPNYRARSFARRRTQVIGLVYGRPADYIERSEVVSALVERLADLDHELLLIPARGPLDQWANKLRDGRMDGVLVTHPMPLGLDEFISQHRLPAVLLNLRSDLPVPQVCFDDRQGTRLAMDHLLSMGHRRIAYLSTPKRHGEHYSNVDRREEYVAAMRDAGLGDRIQTIELDADDYVPRLLGTPNAERPTALLIYNGHDTAIFLRHAQTAGLRVPEDLSVMSFSVDTRAQSTVSWVTQVDTPAADLATASLELLMKQIESVGAAASRIAADLDSRVVLPEHLVPGRSVARLGPGLI